MQRNRSNLTWMVALALPLLLAVSCGRQPTGPTMFEEGAPLLIRADVSATLINTLVVEVTAPDITTPLVFNIEVVDGVASGTIVIPAGSDRTITIRAFDASGIETHRGSATVNVVEGVNPTVQISLGPLTGEQPVEVAVGSFTVEVTPASATVAAGETLQLTVTILDASGDPFPGTASWASLQPEVATVDATGLVTALTEGNAQVVAVFGYVGDSAEITVTSPPHDPPLAYVANGHSDNVTVIETAGSTIVATVDVGKDPRGVAITPDGLFAYVTNHYSDDVSVIETDTHTIVATVDVGKDPHGVAITPDGALVYVANHYSDDVSVIETATHTVVATVDVGKDPQGVAIMPDGEFAYVTNRKSKDVSVIDTAANTVVATVRVGNNPYGIAITPDGLFAYVANRKSKDVSVIETSTYTVVATVDVGKDPHGVAITPDGLFAYVANRKSKDVSVIETSTYTVVATVDVGKDPQGIAITPDGALVYVTNHYSDDVSVIDTVTNTVVATVDVGKDPNGIAITP